MKLIHNLYGIEREIADDYISHLNHAKTTHSGKYGDTAYMGIRIDQLSSQLFKRGIVFRDNRFYRLEYSILDNKS